MYTSIALLDGKKSVLLMPRIFVSISKEWEKELLKRKVELGAENIQDALRDVIKDWYLGRKKDL